MVVYRSATEAGHQQESVRWLTPRNLYGETEEFACAIQDGVDHFKKSKKDEAISLMCIFDICSPITVRRNVKKMNIGI